MLSQGIEWSDVQKTLNENMVASRGGEKMSDADLAEISDSGYKVFDIVL